MSTGGPRAAEGYRGDARGHRRDTNRHRRDARGHRRDANRHPRDASGRLRVGIAAVMALAACTGTGGPGDQGGARSPLLVFAAASLAEAFAEVADTFAAAGHSHGVDVNVAGSQTLAHQITQGAPADVFASSDATQMDVVADAGELAGAPEVFATNHLAIAVEPGNPRGVRTLADLADPGLLVVLPGEQVPAGAYARRALAAAGVTVAPASLEADVRAAMAKVALGEADAAVVYASDVAAAAGRVDGVAVAAEHDVTATYPIAALTRAADPAAARAFVDFVLSEEGQAILARHGFEGPP